MNNTRVVKNVQNNKRDSRTRKVKENDCPSSKESLLTNLTTPKHIQRIQSSKMNQTSERSIILEHNMI